MALSDLVNAGTVNQGLETLRAVEHRDGIFNNSSDQTLGSFWDAIGMIGGSAVQLLPSLLGGGSSSGQARTVSQITAFGQQVNLTLTRLREQMTLGLISPQIAASEAVRVEALLSNTQYVNQPNAGSDRAALDTAKSAARSLVTQFQNEAAAMLAAQSGTTPSATVDPATGQILNTSPFADKNVLLGLGIVGVTLLIFLD